MSTVAAVRYRAALPEHMAMGPRLVDTVTVGMAPGRAVVPERSSRKIPAGESPVPRGADELGR
ncbi:hypothetical protein GCM10022249_12850 [Enteractinococcus coprophilus]